MANLAELFKSCKYLSPLNVVCVLKIVTFRFASKYHFSFYNAPTFRFAGLIYLHKNMVYRLKNIFLRNYFISSTAACAAASLAIGTRNGEQLT